ncbi:class I SAM-dependent methyltransferase [Alkalicoccobacillus murimartini]|uniref:SAM-dependent methyltransferase n=1 Tax=Alkalicoccobacillus murimartini TaxID=171685 RepID=A0ABT9YFK5_9BACI|nr:class I SAM-dependent methyltransferase [Alkalicoccobacillus murimartini]MDQ0206632.1 SAM-dependent methyltransferase [Alkalicoccobacillus murimartini]
MRSSLNIIDELKEYRQFANFQRVLEVTDNLILRESFYEGSFIHFIADLNRDVVWDLELVGNSLKDKKVDLTVLDLGCGDGRLTKFLNKNSITCYGLDYSEDQIKKARELQPKISRNFILGNVLDFEDFNKIVNDKDINVITTTAGTLNCFNDEQLDVLFSNLKKTFSNKREKQKGYLYFPVFSDESVNFFENNFKGSYSVHCFKDHNERDLIAWTSLLYDVSKKSLLQPTLISNVNEGELEHEFSFTIDRIWTTSEIITRAQSYGFKVSSIKKSEVKGGGAENAPFNLIIIEI